MNTETPLLAEQKVTNQHLCKNCDAELQGELSMTQKRFYQ